MGTTNRLFVNVSKSALEEFQENPLSPFVIAWVRCVDLTVPVDGETDAFDLTTEIIGVRLSRFRWMGSCLDRVLLGRKSEGIPAHGVQNIETTCFTITGKDVRGSALGMPDMQTSSPKGRGTSKA